MAVPVTAVAAGVPVSVVVVVFAGAGAGFTSTPDITQRLFRHVNPFAGCAVTHPLARPAPPPPDEAVELDASGGCQYRGRT